MSKKSLSLFEIGADEERYLTPRLSRFKPRFFKNPLTERTSHKVRNAEAIVIFIYSTITERLLAKLPNLRFIATASTGYDHIDMSAVKKRGIIVSNVPSYGENTVAEHTFALILSLSRKIHHSYNRTKAGDFSLNGLRGFDLKGKTIGIIGTGHIGSIVARIAYGFEMKILAYDVYQSKELKKRFKVNYVPFIRLLKESDIVTLHAPYLKSTHHLINEKSIKFMKKGSLLINTARGGLVDTKALVLALKKGILAGAGLDVLEAEALIKEESELLTKRSAAYHDIRAALEGHMLLSQNNVLVTPHNAFNSVEAIERILDTTVSNVFAYFKGKPINIVKY